MNSSKWLLSFAIVVFVASLGLAQQPADVGPVKIAFFDVERAVATIDEGQLKIKEIRDWAQPKQDELARLNKEISDLQADVASKRGAASEDLISDMERRLVSKQREFEDKQRIAKRDFEQKQTNLFREIGQKMQDLVTKYADANRFTAVFILKPNDMAYIANSADLTDIIIKQYNEKYPVAAKAAAPAGK